MANYTNLNNLFTDMANAIRAKKNSTATIVANNFATEIEGIKSGFDYNNHDVTAIPDYAFYGCEDLNSVDCYNLTSVGNNAFENCKNLKSVILYDGVEYVGENAFKGCNSELVIYCMFDSQPDGWNENWNVDNHTVKWCGGMIESWNDSKTNEDSITVKLYNSIDERTYSTYSIVIDGKGNTKDYTGYNLSPWQKKYQNRIISAIILNGITSIGNSAFNSCEGLTSINIPNSVTSIGNGAFSGCSNLTSITIPNSVTSIGNNAFYSCIRLTSIIISDGITSLGYGAFYDCRNLKSVTIPNSVTSIGDEAFAYCTNLTSINIGNSVTSVGNRVFSNCTKLTSINIPNGVTSIGNYAFYNCDFLTSITIPNGVTNIGECAFRGCNLLSITFTGTIAQWNAITFDNDWNMGTLKYTIHCTDGDIAKDGTVTYH